MKGNPTIVVRHGKLSLIRSDLTTDQAARYVKQQAAQGRPCTITYPGGTR